MNADDQIAVTLTAQQWNAVLGMLAEQPYRASFPLIQQIQAQCNQQFAGNGGYQGSPPAAWRAGGENGP